MTRTARVGAAIALAGITLAILAGCAPASPTGSPNVTPDTPTTTPDAPTTPEGQASSDATFYIVRHGQTLFNQKGITSGWSDSPLTEKGVSQAKEAGAKLNSVQFAAAVSSDLGRAHNTAELILADNPPATPLTTSELLREQFYGGFEGDLDSDWGATLMESFGYEVDENWTHYGDFLKETTLQQRTDATAAMDETGLAEDWNEYEHRGQQAIQLLRDTAAGVGGGNILVVSHGTTIGLLLELMDPEGYDGQDIPNAAATTVEYKDGAFRILDLPAK